MDIRCIGIFLALLVVSGENGLAWSREGHAAVAVLAAELISADTRRQIQELLDQGGDKDLVSESFWADALVLAARGAGPLRDNGEAITFNEKFPQNAFWHFTNLPLAAKSYLQVSKFERSDDIVHVISHCIEVLEASRSQPEEFTKVQALRLLVHLVGDIHQPLHCGTGFYNISESGELQLVVAPESAAGRPNDHGGNLLFFGPNAGDQLHALWDKVLVEEVDDSFDYRVLADFLRQSYLQNEIPRTPGDYHEWAKIWAIDSVKVAALAYEGIRFGAAEFGPDGRLSRIEISLSPTYNEGNKLRAAMQLARAGAHLAQLLDSINWR